MTTAALTPAGERILRVASGLFYECGINAVGVDRIASEAGTTKKTLYDRFGSKEGLTVAYLRRRCTKWQEFLSDWLAAAPSDGIDRVLAVYDGLAEWMRTNARGCGFVNAYAELAGTGHQGLEVIGAEKKAIHNLYVDLVGDLGVADSATVGGQLSLLHEGAIVASTAGGRDDSVQLARATAETLLRQALHTPG